MKKNARTMKKTIGRVRHHGVGSRRVLQRKGQEDGGQETGGTAVHPQADQ